MSWLSWLFKIFMMRRKFVIIMVNLGILRENFERVIYIEKRHKGKPMTIRKFSLI